MIVITMDEAREQAAKVINNSSFAELLDDYAMEEITTDKLLKAIELATQIYSEAVIKEYTAKAYNKGLEDSLNVAKKIINKQ